MNAFESISDRFIHQRNENLAFFCPAHCFYQKIFCIQIFRKPWADQNFALYLTWCDFIRNSVLHVSYAWYFIVRYFRYSMRAKNLSPWNTGGFRGERPCGHLARNVILFWYNLQFLPKNGKIGQNRSKQVTAISQKIFLDSLP